MRWKFTKLNKILIGLIIILVIVILGREGWQLYIKSEYRVAQRFNEFASFVKKGDSLAQYKMYNLEYRGKISAQKFVNIYKDAKIVPNQKIIVNKIVIDDNTAYIDRTNVVCEKGNCKKPRTLRGYKEWVFENGDWYYSSKDPECIRKIPYSNPAEIESALEAFPYYSLASDRLEDIRNCLEISYVKTNKDFNGYVYFDKNSSSLDKLKILVDSTKSIKGQELMTYLLLPEITKAYYFVSAKMYGQEMGTEATIMGVPLGQAELITERTTYFQKILISQASFDKEITSGIKKVLNLSEQAVIKCKSGSWTNECYWDFMVYPDKR